MSFHSKLNDHHRALLIKHLEDNPDRYPELTKLRLNAVKMEAIAELQKDDRRQRIIDFCIIFFGVGGFLLYAFLQGLLGLHYLGLI